MYVCMERNLIREDKVSKVYLVIIVDESSKPSYILVPARNDCGEGLGCTSFDSDDRLYNSDA